MNRSLISRECSHGLIQYVPLIARVHTQDKCEQDVNRKKKIVVTKVNFRYMRGQSAEPRWSTENRRFGEQRIHFAAYLSARYNTIHV